MFSGYLGLKVCSRWPAIIFSFIFFFSSLSFTPFRGFSFSSLFLLFSFFVFNNKLLKTPA